MITEIGKIGTDKVETYYDYGVESRLAAVYFIYRFDDDNSVRLYLLYVFSAADNAGW